MKTTKTTTRGNRTRTIKPIAAGAPAHVIDGEAVATALYKAKVPNRYVRAVVTLEAFPWGKRLGAWLSSRVSEVRRAGKCAFVSGDPSLAMEVCAMATRTLVVRGKDAMFITLAELIEGDLGDRRPEYLVIAGFYDHEFHKSKGCPMTAAQSHKLSWQLWRMVSEGTTIIAYASPNNASANNWWSLGALDALFVREETLTIQNLERP